MQPSPGPKCSLQPPSSHITTSPVHKSRPSSPQHSSCAQTSSSGSTCRAGCATAVPASAAASCAAGAALLLGCCGCSAGIARSENSSRDWSCRCTPAASLPQGVHMMLVPVTVRCSVTLRVRAHHFRVTPAADRAAAPAHGSRA